MPQIGDTARAYNIGIAGHGLYVWDACPECGHERWVEEKGVGRICFPCGRKALSERKRIPGLQACRPEDLGRKGAGWLYRVPCPECGDKRWVRKQDLQNQCPACGVNQMGKGRRKYPGLEMKYNERGEPRYKSPCPECGQELWRRPEYIGKVCSECVKAVHSAQFSAQVGELHHNWQGGTSFEPYSTEFNVAFKKAIRERDGYICQLCGVKESEYQRTLDVHHIDYDKQHTTQENCIALCGRCNAKVNKNRESWTLYFNLLVAHNALEKRVAELGEQNAELAKRVMVVEGEKTMREYQESKKEVF